MGFAHADAVSYLNIWQHKAIITSGPTHLLARYELGSVGWLGGQTQGRVPPML